MTFSGGNSSRHRRRRMAMEVAGHRGRGNEMSRRATARLRPPEPEKTLPVQYTEQTAAAAQAMELEPATSGVADAETANGSTSVDQSRSDSMVETFTGNGLDLELEPAAEPDQANGTAPGVRLEPAAEPEQANPGARAPETQVTQINGDAPEPEAEQAAEPQPVRFKWDPKTGQAVPIT